MELKNVAEGRSPERTARAITRKHDGWREKPRLVDTALHQGLVRAIAGKFQDRALLDFDDRVSLGNLGLEKAARTFDPSLGFQFSTHATWWIRQSIMRGFDEAGLSPKSAAKRRAQGVVLSIDYDAGYDKHGRKESTLRSILACEDTELAALQNQDHAAALGGMVDRILNPRFAKVIRLRLDGLSLDEIARRMRVSRERIRQIERKALTQLRDALVREHPETREEIDWSRPPSLGRIDL